jgi:hypothetical protein
MTYVAQFPVSTKVSQLRGGVPVDKAGIIITSAEKLHQQSKSHSSKQMSTEKLKMKLNE